MIIEIWGQEHAYEGLRISEFLVESEHVRVMLVDGKRSFRYGKQILLDYGWVLLDTKEVGECNVLDNHAPQQRR